MKPARNAEESGFALLLVFVLAAGIAITLYMEMPRVAFESQRAREQMSIDRGMQYARAIQLFYRKFAAFPQNLEDLETKRNIRFLRHRYKDPLTGKDFRLLHVGPAGNITDSAIKNPNPLQTGQTPGSSQPGAASSFGAQPGGAMPTAFGSQPAASQSTAPAVDANGQPVSPGLNMALRRPSDRITPVGTEQPVAPGSEETSQQPLYPEPQPQYPAQPGQLQPGQTLPGQPQDPSQNGQQPVYPGQQLQPGQQPLYPGQPATAPVYGQPIQPQVPGQPVQPFPGQPGQPQDPSAAGQAPQFPGQQPQYPQQLQQFAGQPDPSSSQPTYPAQPGQPPIPGQPVQPVYPAQPQYPGQPGYPVAPASPPAGASPYNPFAPGQTTSQPYNPFQPNSGQIPGQSNAQPGTNPAPPGGAANLIQQILTTPRQPPASVSGLTTSGGAAGIAGVASNAEGKGIHIVNDHNKYKEWEFLYNLRVDSSGRVSPMQQFPGQNQPGANPNGANPNGSNQPGTNQPGANPFGSTQTGTPATQPTSTSPFSNSPPPSGP